MELKEDDIRLILGLKLKRARQAEGLSLAELGQRTGLSVSYLNEIEKGRKYPKAEKLAALAKALGTTFDKLVSLKLDKHLAPVGELLQGGILKEVPLDLFGIDRGKLVEIIANAPAKVSAFISTLTRIAASYDLSQEHFYFAALRSYQELYGNHFADLEEEATRFRDERGLMEKEVPTSDRLRDVLIEEFGYSVEETGLEAYPELIHIRSVFIPEKRKLLINARLAENQKAFLYAKELGYAFLGLSGQRALMTPWPRATSFDHVLNNSKASYFGGALLLPPGPLLEGLRLFFATNAFDGERLLKLLGRYNSSPEMFALRITNLVPHHLGVQGLFFQRFDHDRTRRTVEPMKEIFLDRRQDPLEIEMLNDAVGAWLKDGLFRRIDEQRTKGKYKGPLCAGHRFTGPGGQVYFVFAIGRMMGRDPDRSLAVCIGVEVNAANEQVIGFLHDGTVRTSPLLPRPVVAARDEHSRRINAAMERLVRDQMARES
ncbi:MAG TPA: helix-turn-helix transcriptional regulator [Flavobacteriales bacterium]|nr:helix-turn-helix transcriptional regulator [Flavobacteriales bacterium]